MLLFRRASLAVAAFAALFLVVGLVLGRPDFWQPAAVACTIAAAIGIGALPSLASFQFTFWILATVVAGMIYPDAIVRGTGIDMNNKWIRLVAIQMVMFGMGTRMGVRDFAGVLKNPWGVCVAIISQFTVMPLVGWMLIKTFALPAEIAAGVILIGACSSGMASNVMCYIARANLPLSVTATACTTLLAPVMTPMWMKLLAGTLVEVSFFAMMVDIIKIVLVPIAAGLLHDYLKWASPRGTRLTQVLAAVSAFVIGVLLFGWSRFASGLSPNGQLLLELLGFCAAAIVVGVVYHYLTRLFPRLDALMPVGSMIGIMYFTTMTTALGRDNLLQVGGLLFVVAVLHNSLGYILGYWLGRAGGLDRNSARTVAIEVGLQNGGLASGLASNMGKLATMGLAAAVFSAWMNVSGSLLANYWQRRPITPRAPVPSGKPIALAATEKA